MKHAISIVFGIVIAVAIGMLIWPNSTAQAQSGCRSFQAIAQAEFPSSTPLGITFDEWGGFLHGMLGSEPLSGVFSGNDGPVTSLPGAVWKGQAGSYTVGVGCNKVGSLYVCEHTVTYEVPHAVFTAPLPPPMFGHYIGNTARIVGGTGIFRSASGNLNVNGPFTVWSDSASPVGISGRWNTELSGNICGIQ